MATLQGVAIPATGMQSVSESLPALGVTLNQPVADGRGIFVDVGGWSFRRPEALALKVSECATGPVFEVTAQTNADVYLVAEYQAGKRVREIHFVRDGDGWCVPMGPSRPWEVDFHFALPVEAFVDRFADDEEGSDAKQELVRRAHETRSLEMLPHLPEPSGAQVWAFVAGLGIDLPPIASYRKPGLLRRLLGR